MPAIVMKQVVKHFTEASGVVKAVDNVDLSLERGEFTVIAGPSGSGKTTLLNLIGGLDRPDSGEIHLGEYHLHELSDSKLTDIRLREIGFVFQAYNLIPVLTVFENIQFILDIQGVLKSKHEQKILPLLEALKLSGLETRFPPQLSGGQQQRVAVARAMVGNPKIILADEPTANLDSENSASLLELMSMLNREQNVTFLFSSHDPLVINMARRVIRMRDGRIESDETRH